MAHRPGGINLFDNLKMVRKDSSSLSAVSTVPSYNPLTGLYQLEEFVFTNASLTVVDSGGVTGGWVALDLATVDTTRYAVVAGFLDVTVHSAAAGISATGDILFGLGHVAADDGSPTTTQVNLAGLCTVTLVGGAGTNIGVGPAAPEFVVTGTDPKIWLNLGVADADISADAAVTFSALARIFLLDLSRGV